MPRDGRGTAPGVARRSALRGRCGGRKEDGGAVAESIGEPGGRNGHRAPGLYGELLLQGMFTVTSHGAGKRPFAEVGDPGGPASDSRAFQGAPAGEGVGQAWETEELMPREA